MGSCELRQHKKSVQGITRSRIKDLVKKIAATSGSSVSRKNYGLDQTSAHSGDIL